MNDVRDVFNGNFKRALNVNVIRGDNRHFGPLWNDVKSTWWERIAFVATSFLASFSFSMLFSYAQARYYTDLPSVQMLMHIIIIFFIFSGTAFMFFNSVRMHVTPLLGIIAALGTTLGYKNYADDKELGDETEQRDTKYFSNTAGEWIKLLLSWIGVISGSWAGVYATAVFVPTAFLATWHYGAPRIGHLQYLDPSDPLMTPYANESPVGYVFELLAATILYFTVYWANGHRVISTNRIFYSATVGAGGAFAAAIASPFTGAPVNLLLWAIHAVRTGTLFNAVIYTLGPLTGFGILAAVAVIIFLVRRFTYMDSEYEGMNTGSQYSSVHLNSFKSK